MILANDISTSMGFFYLQINMFSFKRFFKYYDFVFWISYNKCSIVEITTISDRIRTNWFTKTHRVVF